MNNELKLKLKDIEKEQRKLAKERERVEARLQATAAQAAQFDEMQVAAGFKRGRDFVKALMQHYGISSLNLGGTGKKGPGRPRKNAVEAEQTAPKKKRGAGKKAGAKRVKGSRTRVDAALRDQVKALIAEGVKTAEIQRRVNLSYPVVKKVEAGQYDHL